KLSLLNNVLQNRPLIISSYNEYAAHHDSEEQKFKSALSNKVAILSNLIYFYFRNYKNVECFNALTKLFLFYINEEIKLNYYTDYGIYESEKLLTNKVRYENEYVIHYLKILIFHKDFDTANEIFEVYPVKPYNKKQTADYERIKLKLGK
ncbi:MAG: hypothetical protein K2L12_05470, partial [Clostridia bacterium]|nr:hypothetical protein [Clostridia bacterium]